MKRNAIERSAQANCCLKTDEVPQNDTRFTAREWAAPRRAPNPQNAANRSASVESPRDVDELLPDEGLVRLPA